MTQQMVLCFATYPGPEQADADFAHFNEVTKSDQAVAAAVTLHRSPEGDVKVVERGGGEVAEGAGIGAGAGIVVGLLLPPMLLTTAIGAGIGALGGAEARRKVAKHLGEALEGDLPPGSSAVVAVLAADYANQLERALPTAANRDIRPIDSAQYAELGREIGRGNEDILEALPES